MLIYQKALVFGWKWRSHLIQKWKKLELKWYGREPILDESKVFMIVDMKDPSQMKTFGEREDVAKARADAGADVASTTIISQIGEDYLP